MARIKQISVKQPKKTSYCKTFVRLRNQIHTTTPTTTTPTTTTPSTTTANDLSVGVVDFKNIVHDLNIE